MGFEEAVAAASRRACLTPNVVDDISEAGRFESGRWCLAMEPGGPCYPPRPPPNLPFKAHPPAQSLPQVDVERNVVQPLSTFMRPVLTHLLPIAQVAPDPPCTLSPDLCCTLLRVGRVGRLVMAAACRILAHSSTGARMGGSWPRR
jgi:hypothetical protein